MLGGVVSGLSGAPMLELYAGTMYVDMGDNAQGLGDTAVHIPMAPQLVG